MNTILPNNKVDLKAATVVHRSLQYSSYSTIMMLLIKRIRPLKCGYLKSLASSLQGCLHDNNPCGEQIHGHSLDMSS